MALGVNVAEIHRANVYIYIMLDEVWASLAVEANSMPGAISKMAGTIVTASERKVWDLQCLFLPSGYVCTFALAGIHAESSRQ